MVAEVAQTFGVSRRLPSFAETLGEFRY